MDQRHHHHPGRRNLAPEIAQAEQAFDLFCNATTLKSILGHFRHVCELIKIKPNHVNDFYPKLKSKLDSWKAKALWKKFDQRAAHKCYARSKACPNTRVLIIGGGPCGLRSAIEAQLLGAKVVVIEKRDRMSRNNVLHLWPFVIQDLRNMGAKKFFGKFCAGSIDHISIRQLQCILLKVALILGVEFHENVSFDSLMPPPENQTEGKIGWRAAVTPVDHPVSQYEFDVLIGADGKRNTLEGFKRTEFRGRLAIAITANFINKRTEAEARVEEISGVAFIFNQKFFKELYQETGIDLENIVYYKDDTHYFVMTAKKHSLIDKGVILQDHADTARLLAKENVDRDALMLYARQAAEFSTNYQMLNMEFAVNHYGQPDVAMFDFTSMYAAENASRVVERFGHKLLMLLVGDSLLEPFWPTGSGCARGFLSSLDAGWAIKGWGGLRTPLEVIAERESIYRLLGQTTPENLNKDCMAYTLDPHSRYPNLNAHSVTPLQVQSLLDTDDPESIKKPPVHATVDVPKKRRRKDTQIHPDTLLDWLKRQVALYDTVHINDISTSFKSGLAVCAIIHRYRPDLLDFHALKEEDVVQNNQLAFDILEKELGIPPVMTGIEMAECEVPDKLTMYSYLTQIYEAFRGEIPHIKHPKLVEPELEPEKPTFSKELSNLTIEQKAQFLGRFVKTDSGIRSRQSRSRTSDLFMPSEKKNMRKRRSTEKMGATVEERQKRLEQIELNRVERMRKRQYMRKMATQQFYKSMQMLQANAKREKDEPFEDYSIFLYRQTAPDFKDRVKDLEQKILYPDREPKMHAGHHRSGIDEEFSGRIKSIEDKLKGTTPSEKKPKDLLRAIGKIEKSDWNVKEIEKKIEENKMGRGVKHDRVERVPKWSREQFLARQTKMEKRGRDAREFDSKYADFDNTLKNIDKKIKEGNVLGHNKVSAMAEQFANKNQDAEPKVQKSNSKAAIPFPVQKVSEICHFCDKTVYLMEKLSAEGKSFHRGCFRCEYCSISLRIGHHTFDRDKDGGRFYCAQHFGLPGTMKMRIERKPSVKMPSTNKENMHLNVTNRVKGEKSKEGLSGLDLLDRGQTPERIEFENLAGVSDTEEPRSQMDEDEWTDRNFGASAAEMGSSDELSDMSDSDDDNVVYEEAIDQPVTKEGTLELAKNWTLRYSQPYTNAGHSDTGSNEYEDSSDDYSSEEEDSATATEDEDDVRARELRKQEVWLKVPPRGSDTDSGSETEVASNDNSTEESEENSATEISTDSEFEHDGTTPTQHEIPEITINDAFVRKTRGDYVEPKKVKVKSRLITTVNGNSTPNQSGGVKLQFSTLEESKRPDINKHKVSPDVQKLMPQRKGDYSLNRTHSTEGIASKISLELKKRYLLGGPALGGSVIKSGSTSNVNTRLQNLTDSISQHQKLLNPAPEPSPTMQAFLQGTSKLRTTNQVQTANPFGSPPIKVFPFEESILAENKDSQGHLPDLVKETSILKSKTESSIDRLRSLPVVNERTESPKEVSEKVTVNGNDLSKSPDNDVCRPRSPLHETSIIVPQVDWPKNKDGVEKSSSEDSEMDSDSLSSSSSDEENLEQMVKEEQAAVNLSPPRLQIHSTNGDLLLDEEANRNKEVEEGNTFEPDSIECILLSESEIVEQDKKLEVEVETLNNNLEQLELQDDSKRTKSACSSPTSIVSLSKHDDSENDVTTAAYTETEFSEWARDSGAIEADDLHEADLNSEFVTRRKPQSLFSKPETKIDASRDIFHNSASVLLTNGEDITFMDTDNESLLDSLQDVVEPTPVAKNRGYVKFVNVEPGPVPQEKISAPIAKTEIENEFDSEDEPAGNDVIKMSPVRVEDIQERLKVKNEEGNVNSNLPIIVIDPASRDGQMDEDSLLVVEPTEDTTTSEVTTIVASPVNPEILTFEKEVSREPEKVVENPNPDYLEYVKRLQSRIAEFSNAKDSIDVRKSKRKNSKPMVHSKTADTIEEEMKVQESNSLNSFNSPATSRKLEEITKERCKQKNLIQDLLMDKLEAHKQKSAEKKAKRAARASSFTNNTSLSPSKPHQPSTELQVPTKFVPTSIVSPSSSPSHCTFSEAKRTLELNLEQPSHSSTPLSVFKSEFKTPVAPPRSKHEEARRTAEKAKQDARERARLKSDEDLGLSPEDKLKELRMKVVRRQTSAEERRKMENELESKSRQYNYRGKTNKLQTSKSTDNMKVLARKMNFDILAASAKSMDELSNTGDPTTSGKKEKKKSKDPERRKSIIQAVSDFFKRKDSPTSPTANKEKLSMFRLTPKSKEKLKLSRSYSEESNLDKITPTKSDTRPKSICEGILARSFINDDSPALPNLPLHCTVTNDSQSDEETKTAALSTSQMSKPADGSCNSIPSKVKAAKRQAQMKRLRMAQEIQRKLEETEVKQRELESRGVGVEKALRGEGESSDREESDLLCEWFDLMRDRSELHRYEKELLVRAQEIQLEDRYERLQQELHDRLAEEHEKSSEEVKKEGEIITEMLEIVAKRDSLIALLEEERQRYQEEDRDLEAQMLAKGLRLTPVKTRTPKYSV